MKKIALSMVLIILLSLTACATQSGGSSAPAGNASSAAGAAQSSKSESAKASENAKPAEPVSIEFYFPVGVGGPIAQLLEGLAGEYNSITPDADIKAIFTGSYGDTLQKLMTTIQGGNPPQLVILANPTLLTMIAADAAEPLDELIAADGGSEYIDDFFPGFMQNSLYDGKIYSIPFQRSTMIMYYNKDHFREVGLDPETPPKTWDELAEYGAKLTKLDAGGNAERWGVMIPSSGAWNFGPFVISNSAGGENLMSDDGKKLLFNTPENVEAMQFLYDLSAVHKASPDGVIKMDTIAANFIEGLTSIMEASTGNMTYINTNAEFDYGTAPLPYSKRPASITGGGNIYMIKGSTDEQKAAAWKFIRWLTEPERQAQWNVDTGYIAARKSAFETEIMKRYFTDVPQAQAGFDQLETCYSEMRVYESDRIGALVNNAYDSVVTGESSPADAFAKAQKEADEILAQFQ